MSWDGAKLTKAQVLKILRDKRLHREIAAEFGISKSVVKFIKTGRSYADITNGKTDRRGQLHHVSKLTRKQVLAILHDPRVLSVIAAEYGVRKTAVSNIKTGKRWSHVTKGQTDHRGRGSKGERNGRAKLTESDVRAIRRDRRDYELIAADYEVDRTTIDKIKRRQRWAHVQ